VRRRVQAIVLLSCTLTAHSCAPSVSPVPLDHDVPRSQRPAVSSAGIEKKIHALINHERQKHGLAPLERDGDLADIARTHSKDMSRRRYFGHLSPDGAGFADRYERADYTCSVVVGSTVYRGGENIALNNLYASTTTINGVVFYEWNSEETIARTAVQGWMDSAGHRKNILAPHFLKEGIGVHIAPDDRIYITQNFC
jgi:uncharacterized protein YkwD